MSNEPRETTLPIAVEGKDAPNDWVFEAIRAGYERGAMWHHENGSLELVEKASHDFADKMTSPSSLGPKADTAWQKYSATVDTQPASTARIERQIRKAGQVAIDELIERMDGKHPGDDDLADYLTRIVDACARAALSASQSTSRKGER